MDGNEVGAVFKNHNPSLYIYWVISP